MVRFDELTARLISPIPVNPAQKLPTFGANPTMQKYFWDGFMQKAL